MSSTVVLSSSTAAHGGVSRHIFDLAEELMDRGVDVRVHMPKLKSPAVSKFRRAQAFDLFAGQQRIIHVHKADTYNFREFAYCLLAKIGGNHLVLTEHLPRSDASDAGLSEIRHRATAWWLKTALKAIEFWLVDRVVVPSRGSAEFLRTRYNLSSDQLQIIPNGVRRRTPAGDVDSAALPNLTGVMVGSLIKQKGVDLLIKAMTHRRTEWRLVVVGTGPHLSSLMEMAASLQVLDDVKFVGWIDSVDEFIQSEATVVLCGSRWESSSYALLDAMNAGLPVVSMYSDGPAEIIAHGENGYLVKAEDVKSFAERVEDLLHDPGKRRAMGSLGQQRVETLFSLGIMADRLLQTYSQLENHV